MFYKDVQDLYVSVFPVICQIQSIIQQNQHGHDEALQKEHHEDHLPFIELQKEKNNDDIKTAIILSI